MMMLSGPSSFLLGRPRSWKASSPSSVNYSLKPLGKVLEFKMAYDNGSQQASITRYECLLFDLDDTLYAASTGFSKHCSKNVKEYMVQKLGIEESKVSRVNRVLYKNYGTSAAGLKAIGYDFDNDDFYSFVHGTLPYENLKPDPVLRNLLLSLPIRKVIFTNADKVHVAKVLNKLGLEDCFDGIVSFETLNPTNRTIDFDDQRDLKWTVEVLDGTYHFDGERDLECTGCGGFTVEVLDGTSTSSDEGDLVFKGSGIETIDTINDRCHSNASSVLGKTPIVCKPFKEAFEQAFKIANITPEKTLFFDDSIRNLEAGKKLGLHTVLVGTSCRINGADYALESIHNIREALR